MTPVRTSPAPQRVYADTFVVTARSGRLSQALLVRCPFCGPHVVHQHRASLSFVSGRRKSPCGGCYVVVSNVLGFVREVA